MVAVETKLSANSNCSAPQAFTTVQTYNTHKQQIKECIIESYCKKKKNHIKDCFKIQSKKQKDDKDTLEVANISQVDNFTLIASIKKCDYKLDG